MEIKIFNPYRLSQFLIEQKAKNICASPLCYNEFLTLTPYSQAPCRPLISRGGGVQRSHMLSQFLLELEG